MPKLNPIIAVNDVLKTAAWYAQIFGFTNSHGNEHFAVLEWQGEVMLCLHKWASHGHPSLSDDAVVARNGLLLYFRTGRFAELSARLLSMGWPIEEGIHLNPNSRRKEFSFRDPDGYYITVTEYHEFKG